MGEISLISESGILYLAMENNLLPPVGTKAEVYNNYMVKIGEIQITDISEEFCVAVDLEPNQEKSFEKGNIVKAILGSNGNIFPSSHDEKYLICSECSGTGELPCTDCDQDYIQKDGIKIPCPDFIICEFCNGLGFTGQP